MDYPQPHCQGENGEGCPVIGIKGIQWLVEKKKACLLKENVGLIQVIGSYSLINDLSV